MGEGGDVCVWCYTCEGGVQVCIIILNVSIDLDEKKTGIDGVIYYKNRVNIDIPPRFLSYGRYRLQFSVAMSGEGVADFISVSQLRNRLSQYITTVHND